MNFETDTVLLLLQHHQELAYPTQEGWLEALQNMMEKFFADTRQRSFVRRLAVSTLSECIAACRAYRNDGKYFKRKRACNCVYGKQL